MHGSRWRKPALAVLPHWAMRQLMVDSRKGAWFLLSRKFMDSKTLALILSMVARGTAWLAIVVALASCATQGDETTCLGSEPFCGGDEYSSEAGCVAAGFPCEDLSYCGRSLWCSLPPDECLCADTEQLVAEVECSHALAVCRTGHRAVC